MTAVLLQCNRRTLGVVAVQGACIALAIGLAESAGGHGTAWLLTGDAAIPLGGGLGLRGRGVAVVAGVFM